MEWEMVWKAAVTIAVAALVVGQWAQMKVNKWQGRFNREALGLFAALRAGREMRDEVERRRRGVARDAGRGLRGV